MKKIIIVLIIVLLATGLQAKKIKVPIHRIIDGDTFDIILNDEIKRISPIGYDCPESRENKKTIRDSERTGESVESIIKKGRLATDWVKKLLRINKYTYVYIEYDKRKIDKYKRLLVYIYLPDGRMLNRMMLINGYAVPMTIKPNVLYKKEFQAAYDYAVKHKRGIWK